MQKAKDLSEITKLNMAVSESETKINEIYSEIGYKVYCAYRENPLEEVKEEIGQIRELEEAMEACKLQIQAINAMNSCPRCGAKIKPEMMFCSSCGMKLQSEEQETVEEEQERPAFCSECGAPLVRFVDIKLTSKIESVFEKAKHRREDQIRQQKDK